VKRAWRRMVGTYLRNRPNLKAVVVIVDIRRGLQEEEREMIEGLDREGKNVILVLTKIDKLSRRERSLRVGQLEKELAGIVAQKPILFSAKTGEGRKEIWDRLLNLTKA
jgi:GTP-binding protein